MTLVIETCCSFRDQSSIKTLSAKSTLCASSLWSEVSTALRSVSPGEWGRPLGSLPHSLSSQGSGPFQASLFSGLLKSICKAKSLGSEGQQAASSWPPGLVLLAAHLR